MKRDRLGGKAITLHAFCGCHQAKSWATARFRRRSAVANRCWAAAYHAWPMANDCARCSRTCAVACGATPPGTWRTGTKCSGRPFDIMLETKGKYLALLRLRMQLLKFTSELAAIVE